MIGSSPTLSVSEFVAVFNQSVDMMFPSVGIVGELSNYRISKGAWVYFDLKDDDSSVKFFGSVRSLPGPLEEGMLIEVQGRPYLHPRFGFSVQFSSMKPVGEGVIKQAKDLLAKKLKTEGLFDPARKRVLTYPPSRIALITSAESAAYSDFVKILNARWPYLSVDLFDVLVQGVDAPGQIIDAVIRANQQSNYDALIIIRGGGTADDLVTFDDERVVRSIAGSRIPTMIAIGHERDVSLSELAADNHASTPSNAAELLVPDRRSEMIQLKSINEASNHAVLISIELSRQSQVGYSQYINERINAVLNWTIESIETNRRLIDALDPRKIEAKGFVLIRDQNGKVLKSSKAVRSVGTFIVDFRGDPIKAKVQ